MSKIILAVDVNDMHSAIQLIDKVRGDIGMIKIGPELWANHGPEALELGRDFNLPMFLDLKLHDIPNTVSKTASILANKNSAYYHIAYISVHCFGGLKMLQAAQAAVASTPASIVAVTLLTSLNSEDMREMGMNRQPGIRTTELAQLARSAGIENFVTSPTHIELLRKNLDKGGFRSTLICPGVRSSTAPPDDQKRTKPVSYAIKAGADWLVIGRPITQSPDPAAAARDILEQIKKATPP